MVDYISNCLPLVFLIYNVKELEVFTYHLPVEMALVSSLAR